MHCFLRDKEKFHHLRKRLRVLIAGESGTAHTTFVAGIDSLTFSSYQEGVGALRSALMAAQHEVDYLPAHLVPSEFPEYEADLAQYDVIALGDIGANSFLLSPAVQRRSERRPNRLNLLASWVHSGGGLLMIGGWLSFGGMEGKARFCDTPIDDVLPVACERGDDRVEVPEGATANLVQPSHPVLLNVPSEWPHLLGWNRTHLRKEGELLASIGSDPLVAVRIVGKGRTAVFTSDCSAHWAPPGFLEWHGYPALWDGLITWLGQGELRDLVL